MTETTVDQVLEEAAAAVNAEGTGKKVRKPKADGEPRAPKEPKAPKVKLYKQWNDDGTPKLDAEGNQVMGETKMAKPKKPRPEGSRVRVSHPDTHILHLTEVGAGTKFREGTKRQDNFAAIKDGMTVGDYFAATGGRAEVGTFLIWYVGQGLVTVTAPEEAQA